jgi:hypothetical protein
MKRIKEIDIQRVVNDWVKYNINNPKRGVILHLHEDRVYGIKGIPDLFGWVNYAKKKGSIPIAVELKRKGGKLSKEQKEKIEWLKERKCNVEVFYNSGDCINYLEKVLKNAGW